LSHGQILKRPNDRGTNQAFGKNHKLVSKKGREKGYPHQIMTNRGSRGKKKKGNAMTKEGEKGVGVKKEKKKKKAETRTPPRETTKKKGKKILEFSHGTGSGGRGGRGQ